MRFVDLMKYLSQCGPRNYPSFTQILQRSGNQPMVYTNITFVPSYGGKFEESLGAEGSMYVRESLDGAFWTIHSGYWPLSAECFAFLSSSGLQLVVSDYDYNNLILPCEPIWHDFVCGELVPELRDFCSVDTMLYSVFTGN